MLSNAGTADCYSDFKPFTLKETLQNLGVLICPSPSPWIDTVRNLTSKTIEARSLTLSCVALTLNPNFLFEKQANP